MRIRPPLRLLTFRVALPAALLLAAACARSAATNSEEPPGDGTATVNVTPTLSQSVTIEPGEATSGQNLSIRSVLVNRGSAPVDVEARICGLDFAGTLALTHPPEVMKCAGYSQQATVAPGDSLEGSDLMRVTSPAGRYTLRVKHAVLPEGWAELAVVVR